MTPETDRFGESEKPTDGGTPLLLAVGSMWALVFDALGAAHRRRPETDTRQARFARKDSDWPDAA